MTATLLTAVAGCAHVDAAAFEVGEGESKIAAGRAPEGVDAFFYRTDLAIDYDGAATAYHPRDRYDPLRNPKGKGLDWTTNAGRSGRWWALASDSRNRPYIQKKGIDPQPGFYVSTTSLFDPKVIRQTDPRRYVDATRVPYIVLPPVAQRSESNPSGAQLGDFAAVVKMKNRKVVYAIFADSGPQERLGEGSMALAQALENAGDRFDVVTVVFPGSRRDPPWPLSNAEIKKEGARRFEAFGGLAHIDELCDGGSFRAPAVKSSAR